MRLDKTLCEETKLTSESDSTMTQMLELGDRELSLL